MRQIVLDTETTGLSPQQGHRIIEVGCIELINRKITGNNLHFYINPEREIEKGAQEVHGLSLEFLKDKPVFSQIAQQLFDYLNGAELVIHNAPFDIGFLNYEFKLLKSHFGRITEHCPVIDTLMIARKKHPGQHNSLDALCRRYFVDNTDRELHGALLDARLLAQVYLLMTGGQAQMFDENQINNAVAEQVSSEKIAKAALKIIRASAEELAAHEEFMETVVK